MENFPICLRRSPTSICSASGRRLRSIELQPEDAVHLEKSARALFRSSKRDANGFTRLDQFKNWLKEKENSGITFDMVLDGANIGHYAVLDRRSGMNYEGIDALVRHIRDELKRTPLLILHWNRTARAPSKAAVELVRQWREAGILYEVPRGENDDWYWLYAAVVLKSCIAVTNDLMRDHVFLSLNARYFKWWRERHVAKFSYKVSHHKGLSDVIIRMPSPHSIRTQQSSDHLAWHIPVLVENEEECDITDWCCIEGTVAK